MQPRYAINILNWNDAPATEECVASLLPILPKKAEVFVLDNGSGDADYSSLRNSLQNFRSVTLKRSAKNMGFTGGHNYLYEIVKPNKFTHILIVNNDTVFKPDFFNHLSEAINLYGQSEFKIFSPTIFEYNRSLKEESVWQAGPFNRRSQRPIPMKRPTGCILAIDIEVINKIGFFDNAYFAYSEEVDFLYRARVNGFKALYVPKAVAWHKVVNFKESQMKVYMIIRNKWYYWKKLHWRHKPLYLLYMLTAYLPKRAFSLLSNRSSMRVFLLANFHGILWILLDKKPSNPFINDA